MCSVVLARNRLNTIQQVSKNKKHIILKSTILPQGNNKKRSKITNHNDLNIVIYIKKNDDFNHIAKRLGIDSKIVSKIVTLKYAHYLQHLSLGKTLNFRFSRQKKELYYITYDIEDFKVLVISNINGKWVSKITHMEPVVKTKYLKGTINSLSKNNLVSSKLMKQLLNAMNSRVNANKIKTSDSCSLFYNEYHIKGKKIKEGAIAAELRHGGKFYRIISFTDPKGHTNFYTPEGRSLKSSFSRFPVDFRKIGSRFSLSRYHPILGYSRPHLGVDFTASLGTPVKSTCNGKIIFAGHKSGYGSAVIVKHGIYSTLYAHLSRFSSNIHYGKLVKQGDIIGYVGSSGLSTGPHLHYEFHIHGTPKDPLKVELPIGEMISPEYRKQFLTQSNKLMKQLDTYRKSNERLLHKNNNHTHKHHTL